MYHKIGIEKLSHTQLSKLLNGHRVRVKHGHGHEVHVSEEQHKKILKNHKKGMACTIQFDPYQMHHHQHLRGKKSGEALFPAGYGVHHAHHAHHHAHHGHHVHHMHYGHGEGEGIADFAKAAAKTAVKTLAPVAIDAGADYLKKKVAGSGLKRRGVKGKGVGGGKGRRGSKGKGFLSDALHFAAPFASVLL